MHTLKIDRAFVITMLANADTMTLVSTMISLAHSLRLKVVAEGVDATEQADALRLMGCDGWIPAFGQQHPDLQLLNSEHR